MAEQEKQEVELTPSEREVLEQPEHLPEGARLLPGFEDDDEPEEVEDLNPDDILSGDDDDEPEAGDKEPEPEKQEPEKFDFKSEGDEKPQDDTKSEQGKEPEYFDIVHRGEVKRVTKEQAINLAQKGFDYDTKVGPHGKLVQLVEADPGLQKIINEYVQQKVTGKPAEQPSGDDFKPIPYEHGMTAEEWLKKNQDAYGKHLREQIVAELKPQPDHRAPQDPRAQQVAQLGQRIFAYDPQDADKVVPHLATIAQQHLTKAQYDRLQQGNWEDLRQFYHYAKQQVLGSGQPAPQAEGQPRESAPAPQQQQSKPKPPFRAKSGGGEAPKTGDMGHVNAWDRPRDEFFAILNKVKGFE